MALGYILAVLAAVASGGGSVFFLGLGVDLLGFLCAAAALRWLPLYLVQSLLAFSVGVTATISAFMGTRLATAGWVALGIGATGLILLGVAADPGPARILPTGWRWVLLGLALPVAAIAWYTRRRGGFWAASALAFGSGLGFCVVGISARSLAIPDAPWRLVLEPAAWSIILNGLLAATVFTMALQKGSATAVTAIMFPTKTALASLIGLAYLDDRVRAGFAAAAVAGFVLAITGAVGAAHYASRARHKVASSVRVS